jgi:hypothetical protein
MGSLRGFLNSVTVIVCQGCPLTVGTLVTLFLGLVASPVWSNPSAPGCDWRVQPQPTNSERQGEVIVIGLLSSRPYRVILPGGDETMLDSLRACLPDAFITDSRLGPYVQAGAFATRSEAVELTRQMQAAGLPARLVHLRGYQLF